MTSRTIDIMLPFYGRTDHFVAAVESVLAQSDPDWHLTIIDDANPDPAGVEWAASLDDERIEIRRNASNRGINASFQECVALSTRSLVTIFGCDDFMRPNYVARVKALAIEYPEASMIHPGVQIIDADGAPATTLVDTAKRFYRPSARGRSVLLSGEALARSVIRGNWMNFPAVAWDGASLRSVGFRPGYHVVQDLALVIDLCIRGGGLLVDDVVAFEYRRHVSSVSSWRTKDGSRFVEEGDYFREVASLFAAQSWRKAERAARVHLSSRINALTMLPAALRAGDAKSAKVLSRHVIFA